MPNKEAEQAGTQRDGTDGAGEVRIAITQEELAVESVNCVGSDVDGRGGEFAF